MSILLPHINDNAGGVYPPMRLALPSAAAQKPAGQAAVLGFWMQTPPHGFKSNTPHTVVAGAGGVTGGNDTFIRLDQTTAPTTMTCTLRRGGVNRFDETVPIPGLGMKFLVLLIINPTATHLVTCEPGQSPNVITSANSDAYDGNWSSVPMFDGIGCGSSPSCKAYGGLIEELFMCFGEFPETGGAPQTALIQNIANGSQDIDALTSQLTGGSRRFRYRMLDKSDLADSFGVAGDLTTVNESAENGFILRTGGDLRPRVLRPNTTSHHVSQAVFGTAGDVSTAYADVTVEGGAYSGVSPDAIQARLLSSAGAEVVGWTVVDANPANGTWAESTLSDVPMTTGMLELQFRAVDDAGSQIGEIVRSDGLRGVGFSVLMQGQSQLMYMWGADAGLRLPTNVTPLVTKHTESGTEEAFLGTGESNITYYITRGMAQLCAEIATLYPGYPIHISTVGQSGRSLEEWNTGGPYVGRWAGISNFWGVKFPYYLLWMGHSNNSTSIGGYRADLEGTVGQAEVALGAPVRHVIAPTARYAQAAEGGSFVAVSENRQAQRDWFEDNKSRAWLIGSMSHIVCETGDLGPHPNDTDAGQGRSGAMLAWGLLTACRAVADQPLEIASATDLGDSVELRLGATNTL